MDLELDFIEKLVKLMSDNNMSKVELRDGERSILLSRSKEVAGAQVQTVMPAMMAPMNMPVQAAPVAAPVAVEAESAEDAIAEDIEVITSPMVGTFYRAPSPDADPFVEAGEAVGMDTTIAIIEAMKVMNEIKAEMSGEVVKILVANGESVEWGQPLFHIRRA